MVKSGKKLKVFLHLVVWAILFVFPSYFLYVDSRYDFILLQRAYIQTALYAVLFYLNYLWLAPRLFFRKKKMGYFVSAILCVAIATTIMELSSFPSMPKNRFIPPTGVQRPSQLQTEKPPPMKHTGEEHRPRPSRSWPVYNFILTSVLISGLGLGIRFSDKLILTEKQKKEAEKEKLNAELAFLKNQINPHFLFNTLNSIYSLALMNSDQTPEAVLKLSDMMHYVIYDIQTDKVPLEKDIQYLRHFVELQKIRLSDTTEVHLNTDGDFGPYSISPLLFMAFVENAFKYGASSHEKTSIVIDIHLIKNMLDVKISNQIFPGRQKNSITGIGLRNTRQRLDLEYPNKHSLTLTDNGKVFIVKLSIDLS